nr:D-alanyl-D-alanine carboxypeptidase family protein [uncultured Merdimonas sp.]
MKVILSILLCLTLCVQPVMAAENTDENMETEESETPEAAEGEDAQEKETQQQEIEISAPSAILMEASTGQVIFEKNPDEQRPPASVTKIMTLLLIFDALESGQISLEDEVTTSEHAASMGGSQVFLEPGEIQTVDTLIKCIAVASGNDACVAMAEYIAGSEEEFVRRMNERAQELGMENTHFVNCNGLDADGHLTTARDIGLMSRELITTYPQIRDYAMIWMENITHNTQKGTSEFGLTNTNKLVRHYEYATGLKTGSTSQAKFCISATAEKNGMELIAVIMAAETSKDRTKDAIALLNYGFGKCSIYQEEAAEATPEIAVRGGVKEKAATAQETAFTYINTSGADLTSIERKVKMKESLKAPVKQGQEAGKAFYYLDGEEIGSIKILTTEEVKKMSYPDAVENAVENFLP